MTDQELVPRRPVLLVIVDGFGINPNHAHNAVAQAMTPRLDKYFSQYPLTSLQASGSAVGLPDGQMGNSEVGHLTIGCGEIIRQDLVAIDEAVADGSFFYKQELFKWVQRARDSGGRAHLVGLVSDGGVHSHYKHLLALIDLCQQHALQPVVHMISDGRDTPPDCAARFLPELEQALSRAGGFIATLSGRYYAMDRDQRWDRTQLAWNAMILGRGLRAESAGQAIELAYQRGETDEFILPTVINEQGVIRGNEAVLFFNFRKDRARQLTAALFSPDFGQFARPGFSPITVTCMTQYDERYHLPFIFTQQRPQGNLAELLSQAGLRQFHCAETEKSAHITYFFNGRQGEAYPGEDRVIVPSPKVATYDLAPAMSAAEVSEAVVKAMSSQTYAFIAVNFANGDMVGHSGKHEAIVKSVEALDEHVGKLLDQARELGYSVLLTADHGNCEMTMDPETGSPHTQHTSNPVPCMVLDDDVEQLSHGAGLSSIAATVLELMGLEVPTYMARSLLSHSLAQLNVQKAG